MNPIRRETTGRSASGTWRPSLGAWIEGSGVRFRVWAPEHERVDLVLEDDSRGVLPLEPYPDGTWGIWVEDLAAGTRYKYRLAAGEFPDPASRFQPAGVHGPSQVIDAGRFAWSDAAWPGISSEDLVIYELHVGTFSPSGTFEGVRQKLEAIRSLGVTAIELMPVAQFPGVRNWGYDGVYPFAPAHCYGTPDELRRLVDAAHDRGLAVLLDVVYNHLGPEGNYLPTFSPFYFHENRESPWGPSLNFDGPHSSMVRRYFIENALYWLHEFHFDGLRLDATHAIEDESDVPFLSELATRVRTSVGDRPISIIAEDNRNLATMIRPEGEGGWGMDALWADDFHHGVRVCLAEDRQGYYRDYTGSTAELSDTINQGWLYTGQQSPYLGVPRGTDPSGIPLSRMVFCIQNHDQIGNRALGERLHHQVEPAAYRAATTLLLCTPGIPLLFMGQEWGASSPFLYFTDHPEELGKLVTEGRRREFRNFQMFRDELARESIPDPQSPETFARCRLDWRQAAGEPHRGTLALYRALLAMRRSGWLGGSRRQRGRLAWDVTDSALLIRRETCDGAPLLAIVQLLGAGSVDLTGHPSLDGSREGRYRVLLTSEDRPFAPDPQPASVELADEAPRLRFRRPGAVLLAGVPSA